MLNRWKLLTVATVLCGFLVATPHASLAFPISLTAGETLSVEWSINAPPGPGEVGAVQLIALSSSSSGGSMFSSSLYDDLTLLGMGGPSSANSYRFARAGSFWAGFANSVVVDFTSIDDATLQGRTTLTVNVGGISFDTDDLVVQLVREAGGSITNGTTITNIAVIPEPSSALLLLGAVTGLSVRRKLTH